MIDRANIGRVWPTFETQVERSRLRTFSKSIGETDPIYFDDEAARARGYRAIVAPPTFAFCFGFDEPDQFQFLRDLDVPLSKVLHGEETIKNHEIICAGDRVRCTRRVTDIFEKKGGALEFVTFDTEVRSAESDALVAELRAVLVVRHQS